VEVSLPLIPWPQTDELICSQERDYRSACFASYAAQLKPEICTKGSCKPCIIVQDLPLEFAARITLNLNFSTKV